MKNSFTTLIKRKKLLLQFLTELENELEGFNFNFFLYIFF